ncbi:MAG: hypothetical protein Q9212_007252 [Teloschistes hypoglaucus]
MSDAWFKEQIAPDRVEEDGCHSDEARVVRSYLNNKATAQEAAHSITQPILSSDDPNDNVNRLWDLLQTALLELSTAHIPPLAIQDLPDPDFTARLTATTNAAKAVSFTWKGLPGFGHLWADIYKQDAWRTSLSTTLSSCPTFDEKLRKRQELRTAHVKIANIEAHLAIANVGSIPLDWGYDAIADALERHTTVKDFEIPTAKQWIEVAGVALYAGVKEGRESWALSSRRDMGKEEEKMSLARWEFWEARMRECEEEGEVVRDAGKAALREMRSLKGE